MNGQPQRMCVELMKALHGQTMTRKELAEHLGWHEKTVANWVQEFMDQGVLVPVHIPRKPGQTGIAPMGYRLSPVWGGVQA